LLFILVAATATWSLVKQPIFPGLLDKVLDLSFGTALMNELTTRNQDLCTALVNALIELPSLV